MTDLMAGKRGLIMGVANDHSIAWGIAKRLSEQGAELAFTYQGEAFGRRVKPLAASVGGGDPAAVRRRGRLHRRCRLRPAEAGVGLGRLRRARRRLFRQERAARPLRRHDARQLRAHDGDLLLLVHRGGEAGGGDHADRRLAADAHLRRLDAGDAQLQRHGRRQAALESSVRYLAADYGGRNIRVNAISAGPVRTLAGSGVSDARLMFNYQRRHSPLRRTVTIEEIGGTSLYLLSDLSAGVTGEIHFVDCGYNIISMPRLDALQDEERREQEDEVDGVALPRPLSTVATA
jgi:enoyl-[acyl-carrier protein] reductase I